MVRSMFESICVRLLHPPPSLFRQNFQCPLPLNFIVHGHKEFIKIDLIIIMMLESKLISRCIPYDFSTYYY